MGQHDTSFAVKNVDAWHVVLGGKSYWESFLEGGTTGRFLFRPGWRTVYPTQVEAVIVRVEFADGSVGWGEANAPIAPEITGLLVTRVLTHLVGRREFASPFALWDFVYDAQRGRGHNGSYYLDALAALDIAVWDALGKRLDQPVAALLSDAPRKVVPSYLSGLRQSTRDERIARALEWEAQGGTGIKIFGDGNTDVLADELAALQTAVPGIKRWMVDVLWSLDNLKAAGEAKRAYGDLGSEWLECPMVPEDLEGHQALCRKPGSPIALGEHFHTLYEVRPWVVGRGLDVIQPDVGRCGLSGFKRLVDLCAEYDVPITPHMGSGLDIFQAATLHAATLSNAEILCEYQAGLDGRIADAARNAWRFGEGAFHMPDQPGIGVEVDAEALDRTATRLG